MLPSLPPPPPPNRAVVRGVRMFAGLADADVDAVARSLRARQLAPGEMLFRQGEPGATLLIVAEGTLVARVTRADGTEESLGEIVAGEIVGEMAVIDPAPRSASVAAVTAASVYELSRGALAGLRRDAPSAAAALVGAIIRDVTRRLRRIDARIEQHLRGTTVATTVDTPSRPSPAVFSTAPPRPSRPAEDFRGDPLEPRKSVLGRFLDRLRGHG